jgi:gluconate 5-dehydrogenase
MFDFSGKYAVVTGGGRGIGEAIVRRLVADGVAGVAVIDIGGISYANELDPSGERILSIDCDITDREGVKAAFASIYDSFGRVDFMINNAGIARDAMFHKMSDENWDMVIDVDLNGAYNCTRQVINKMRDQEGGRIIFISSIAIYGAVGQSNYAAAKGGLKMLTRNIASEYGEYNIQCNGLGPGYIETPQTAPLRERQADGSRHPFDQFIIAKTPAARWGRAEDLAGPAVFLASAASDFVNGHILYVDGGILAYIGKQP